MTIDKGAYVSDLIDLIPTCKVHANSKTGDSVSLSACGIELRCVLVVKKHAAEFKNENSQRRHVN